MTPTRRNIRRLRAVVAAFAALIAVWHPYRAEGQTTDLVAQGRLALDADRVDEAIATLERAVAADQNDAAALAWLGSARVRKARIAPIFERPGWVRKGFNTLDEAVERFPDAFIAYMVRGITAVTVPALFNKTGVAVKDLSTVVAMKDKQPQDVPDAAMPSVYLHLGLAYKKNGQTAEARATWEKGTRLYPSAPETEAIARELRNL
jgi:tetratricopeptide (TPR) repeat protein